MEEMNTEGDSVAPVRRLTRYGTGVCLIVLVAVIWVAASEWIQWIFGELKFEKPYFMTFFNTTGFCLWNLGFLMPTWRRVPWKFESESIALSQGNRVYSVSELFRCAVMFCPLWFLANCLFNYSLSMTSVASNTILSSTSSIWTLVLSRIILQQPVTPFKLVAVALVVAGSCLVATADGDDHKHSLSGDFIALLSAFCYAAYTTVLKWCLPNEELYNMGMVFGFVGVVNLLLMWPGLILMDLLGVECFELPNKHVLWALGVNALIGTNLSDVLWAKSVILTSPLVATLGLSLTTPLAMIADFILKGKQFSAWYVVGAMLVVGGFTASNVSFDVCRKRDEQEGESAVATE